MLIDYLRIHHLIGHKHLLLPTLCNVSGMAFCGLLVSKSQWDQIIHHRNILNDPRVKRMIVYTALVDLISGMCLTFGLLLTGGAIFVVLYNSCPVWTAILSRFILKRSLNRIQFVSVIMVCIGLMMNVLVNSSNHTGGQEHEERLDQSLVHEKEHGFSPILIVGSTIVLVGSLLHSLMFVLSDMSMSLMHQHDSMESNLTSNRDINQKDKDGIPGEIWSCCLGMLEVGFILAWVTFGILISGFDDEYHREVRVDDGIKHKTFVDARILKIILGLMTLTIISCLHAASFFKLLKNLGAVASALLKGVQAVVVVLLSAVLYCPFESSQCLTWSKFVSMMIVISGVFGYGLGSRKNLTNSKSSLELSNIKSETESLIGF